MDMRLPPGRCWSCNKPMQGAFTAFAEGAREGKDQADLLNSLGLTRYCCRRMIFTQPLTLRHEAPSVIKPEEPPKPAEMLPPPVPKRKAARTKQ